MLLKLTDIGGDTCIVNSEEIIYACSEGDNTIIEFKNRGYLRVTESVDKLVSDLALD